MKKSVNRQIAAVHLTSRIGQTIVAVLGVTFGVSMYIFMNSFMNGVNKAQDDMAFSSMSHIRIFNENSVRSYNPVEGFLPSTQTIFTIRNHKVMQYTDGIKNTLEIISFLEKQPEVTGIASQLNFNVFFRSGSKKISGLLSGVEVINEDKLFDNSSKVISGKWMDLNYQKSGIILGCVLAENLGVKVNDNINILTSDGISKNFVVTGIIETSVKQVDKTKAWLNISSARQLLTKNQDYVSDILINIKDKENTEPFLSKITPVVPYQIESWQVASQQLVAMTKIRNILAIAVSLTILFVAGFGIYNIMTMTINEKIKEIAILKATGFSGHDITVIFLSQAAIIGFIGSVVGVVLGYGISTLVNQVPFEIAGLSTLPIYYRYQDLTLSIAFGIATTLVAGFLPARKASKIDPVIIIRG
ncbi:MAG TPA: ABC transporter permease [Marinilabiliales bacterium]|nr:MAG: ABC transporter permease [Bacteroidetes bacterium GWA2_40_14]OFX59005.1 MAG: ABC transporter permease [Bacteroidetes bacterium GWC2_40_13]OFX71405.1 MAG: ABC transporter permease [Bacteroidetes bacterium GWD2_40_43]OFX91581.1 MAG: ABC transporter permease [Bacteroidetes bacterium GWE2_40_63]OFY19568.1 MAG: ABC transporter permease [Bacteroidetes bacterium GWF2_40_13]OFZ25643.1 MAG: ABC transporter permease [Bacteroidetes bacterium RIFOXYC2_FULL_40_12]HAM97706.1 ABC transporter permeas